MTLLEFLKNVDSDDALIYSVLRIIIIYIYAVFLVRINKRTKLNSSFDFILIIILGAILGGPIYGKSSLLIALVLGFTLMILHAFFAKMSYYSSLFDTIIKGKSEILIKNGKLQVDALKRNSISYEDLVEECRKELKTNNLKEIKEALLERTGSISFKN